MRRRFFNLVSTVLFGAVVACTATEVQADNISFNYQGRIKVQNEAFSGAGLIKLAILNTSGTAVLWSNDGTVGVATGQNLLPAPSVAIGQQIVDGVFSVAVGDVTIPGMAPLDSAIMMSDTPLRLRVWFNDGERGFEQLTPDHKLTDLTLNKIQTGTQDFTIYVNGQTGNDANAGLTPQTAKKTITGAVDIVPDKVRCNITIDIENGIYREMVLPHGISAAYGKEVRFTGDTTWTPSQGGTPGVVIDGSDNGTTERRDYCFYAQQCTGIIVEGITFQNAIKSGLKLENGNYTINRCLAQNIVGPGTTDGNGIHTGPQCFANVNECMAKGNDFIGFIIESGSRTFFTTCTATLNSTGVFSGAASVAQFYGYNNFSSNRVGIQANSMSEASIWPSNTNATRTHITNNSTSAWVVNWGSLITPADSIMTGNVTKYTRYYGTVVGVDPQ